MADQYLDCKSLKCPMPIVQISKTIKSMKAGQTLEVVARDPAFQMDLEAWIRKLGHDLVEFNEGEIQRALIMKK